MEKNFQFFCIFSRGKSSEAFEGTNFILIRQTIQHLFPTICLVWSSREKINKKTLEPTTNTHKQKINQTNPTLHFFQQHRQYLPWALLYLQIFFCHFFCLNNYFLFCIHVFEFFLLNLVLCTCLHCFNLIDFRVSL